MAIKIESKKTKDKICDLFKGHIQSFEECSSKEDINIWHNQAILHTQRIYGDESNQAYMVSKVTDAKDIIKYFEGFIKEVDTIGPPPTFFPSAAKSEITFHNNNNLSQTQNIELNIIFEIIKDELPPARLREIQEIANSEEPKESKLSKITEKLKETGVEVVSSTLAKLLGQAMGVSSV